MFFCSDCAKKNKWPEGFFKSRGHCEVCNTIKECSDLHTSHLPSLSKNYKYRPCESNTPFQVRCNSCSRRLVSKQKGSKSKDDTAYFRPSDPPFTYKCLECIGTGK